MRLIDPIELKRAISVATMSNNHKTLEQIIDEQPTIEERKKGEWLEKEVIDDRKDAKIQQWQQARCSCCNKWHTTPYMYYFENYDYCPNCGARMESGA